MHDIVFCAKNISKQYKKYNAFVLSGVSFSVKKSEFVALLGPSGSGKSTLLHIAGLIDTPTAAEEIVISGKSTENLSDDEKTKIRLLQVGFVYQYHHLLQEFSAIENVMMPMLIAEKSEKDARKRAAELICELGLKDKLDSMPSELSGGQKQRVAIARAVANSPTILLADEPTGNLDHDTAMLVFDDLLKMAKSSGMSAIIATHNTDLVKKMDRTYVISEGRIFEK